MVKKIFGLIIGKLAKKAMLLGNVINQNPTKEENLKAKKRSNNGPSFIKGKKKIPVEKNQKIKEVYSHKGSGYKGKGNVNTDTAVFNKPRKDIPSGKKH
jgi:hypothetical protein